MYVPITYILYMLISISLTVWVANTLFRNGRLFLIDAFHGDKEIADAVNHLLLVGFYLLNIGFVALFLRFWQKPTNLIEVIEYISSKVGIVLVVLGIMHFFNMWNFAKLRRKARRHPSSLPESEENPSVML